jgi:hypothetical protein
MLANSEISWVGVNHRVAGLVLVKNSAPPSSGLAKAPPCSPFTDETPSSADDKKATSRSIAHFSERALNCCWSNQKRDEVGETALGCHGLQSAVRAATSARFRRVARIVLSAARRSSPSRHLTALPKRSTWKTSVLQGEPTMGGRKVPRL